MNSYFRGQGTVAFIVGVLFSIGFLMVGMPMAVGLGMFMGLLNLVPYLQTLGFVPMALLSLLKAADTGENFWWIFFLGFLVVAVVQILQDAVLVPKIMGSAMGLNPAVILLSLSIWGSLLGFIGLIIALPLTTLLISYYRQFILDESPESEKVA
jgi:predicted PurR-regulated permease PerM